MKLWFIGTQTGFWDVGTHERTLPMYAKVSRKFLKIDSFCE